MKIIATLAAAVGLCQSVYAQITTPIIKAGFGVDADLRCNFFNGFVQNGNDDWYLFPGTNGSGIGIIDTTGAAAIVNRYGADLNFRKLPFYRTMSVPSYTVSNNRLLIDAVFIRDYHGDDSTNFFTGNKNSMSPANWSCPPSQQLPDKNDILDMYVHVRRAGPNPTDSLWMFGGLSIENTSGSRYFDFEMYQTDIYYDRISRRFYNYGPQEGHTAWEFDTAGNVTKPGDIIFTAEFGSSTLTLVEARIWVSETVRTTVTPDGFNWGAQFDKASNLAQYGYASIRPSVASGFYTGIQSGSNTWAGPFGLIRENNAYTTVYSGRQFMEISVNLTRLGLDPVTLLGSNACGMPFRRVLAKTRASTSFTAELKDFVGPFDFFLAPRAQAVADVPLFCNTSGISTIEVLNPYPTSVYTWTTADGHIVGSNTGPSIVADMPGTYIVTQQLSNGCDTYATDTVLIIYDPVCELLDKNLAGLSGRRTDQQASLEWKVLSNEGIVSFHIERSRDGKNFMYALTVNAGNQQGAVTYTATDPINSAAEDLYYRIKINYAGGKKSYSNTIRLPLQKEKTKIGISPNPVQHTLTLTLFAAKDETRLLQFFQAASGQLVHTGKVVVKKGSNTVSLHGFDNWAKGMYYIRMHAADGSESLSERFLVQ